MMIRYARHGAVSTCEVPRQRAATRVQYLQWWMGGGGGERDETARNDGGGLTIMVGKKNGVENGIETRGRKKFLRERTRIPFHVIGRVEIWGGVRVGVVVAVVVRE